MKSIVFFIILYDWRFSCIGFSNLINQGRAIFIVFSIYILCHLLSVCKTSCTFMTGVEIRSFIIIWHHQHLVLVATPCITVAASAHLSSLLVFCIIFTGLRTHWGRKKAAVGVFNYCLWARTWIYWGHRAICIVGMFVVLTGVDHLSDIIHSILAIHNEVLALIGVTACIRPSQVWVPWIVWSVMLLLQVIVLAIGLAH